jgi:hypothetical protein
MKKQIHTKEPDKSVPVFCFRTNSNRPNQAETYINPFSKKTIYFQPFNAHAWIRGFRMGVVR